MNQIPFTADALARIRTLLDDSWANDGSPLPEDEQFSESLRALGDSRELFVVVALFPWGDDWPLLECAVKHPLFDKSVALMAYWRCNPPYLYRRVERGLALGRDLEIPWNIVRRIEAAFATRLDWEGSVAVDPREIVGKETRSDDPANPGFRLIPDFMKQPLPGTTIDLRKIRDAIFSGIADQPRSGPHATRDLGDDQR